MSTKRLCRHSPRRNERVLKFGTHSLKLNSLPLDTLITIIDFLEPKDVFSVRRVCQTLYTVSRERAVWKKILRQVCLQYRAFSPTFPLDEMTVSELEYASTAHCRFQRRLWGHLDNTQPPFPISTRILKLNVPTTSPHTKGFKDCTLLPGGRFLLTRAQQGLIQLWDLGYTPDTLIDNEPLGSLMVDDLDCEFECLMQRTSRPSTFIFLAVSSTPSELCFSIHEASPLEADSRSVVKQRASLTCPYLEVDAYVLTTELLVLHGNNYMIVWNFCEDRWAKWEVEEEVLDIIVYEDNVVCLQTCEYTIYKIPTLRPRGLGYDNSSTDHQNPILRVVCPLDGPVYPSPAIWQNSKASSRLEHLDVIGGDDNGKTIISRYILRPISSPVEGIPRIIPIPLDSIVGDDISCDAPRFKSFQLSASHRLLSWTDGGSLKVNMSTLPANPGQSHNSPHREGILWKWPKLHTHSDLPTSYSLCPMSGRMCVSSWDGEIRVLDYVRPPP